MTQQRFSLSAITTFAVIASCTIAAAQDISVSPVRISERREKILEENPKSKYTYNRLILTLRLGGKQLEKMTRIGNLKVKAVDDKGNTISSRSGFSISSSNLRRLVRRSVDSNGKAVPLDRYEFSAYFNPPTRGAQNIAELTGTVTVRIAETASVMIPLEDLKGKKRGDAITNAELTKLGITASVQSFSSGTSARASLKFSGDKSGSIVGCRIVDEQGKDLGGYGSTYQYSKYVSASCNISKKPPENAKLKVMVEKTYKDVQVSLNKKGIALP